MKERANYKLVPLPGQDEAFRIREKKLKDAAALVKRSERLLSKAKEAKKKAQDELFEVGAIVKVL